MNTTLKDKTLKCQKLKSHSINELSPKVFCPLPTQNLERKKNNPHHFSPPYPMDGHFGVQLSKNFYILGGYCQTFRLLLSMVSFRSKKCPACKFSPAWFAKLLGYNRNYHILLWVFLRLEGIVNSVSHGFAKEKSTHCLLTHLILSLVQPKNSRR